ncbi:hypothetical protein H0R92_01275 [Treponema sp. OMZ 840]|uniref:hypothetical protein n=1 Tax=Treponema sp. OMZ 840 TaxID=244313 RepID=UPI003D8A0529
MNNNEDTKIQESELNFYYNRKTRLERADKSVRAFYDGTAAEPPRGLFKALVHTKQSRFMLVSVILCVLVVLSLAFLTGRDNKAFFEGTDFKLSAFSFEESVYVSVKAQQKNNVDRETVSVKFSAMDKEKNILAVQENSAFSDGTPTFYRTIFTDYDIVYVQADIGINGETLTLRTRVEQK